MILEQPTYHTTQRDQQLNDRNRKRRQLAFDAGLGRGVQEHHGHGLKPHKQHRKPAFEPLELAAMITLSVPLYAMVFVALWTVIK